MIFKPVNFVLLYFVFLLGYSLWSPDEPNATIWIILNRFHNLIGITAGLSFAYSNRPIDKGAISFLWVYVFLLLCIDWLLFPGYVAYFAIVAAFFIGWIAYRRATNKLIFSGERTRRSKNNPSI